MVSPMFGRALAQAMCDIESELRSLGSTVDLGGFLRFVRDAESAVQRMLIAEAGLDPWTAPENHASYGEAWRYMSDRQYAFFVDALGVEPSTRLLLLLGKYSKARYDVRYTNNHPDLLTPELKRLAHPKRGRSVATQESDPWLTREKARFPNLRQAPRGTKDSPTEGTIAYVERYLVEQFQLKPATARVQRRKFWPSES